MAGERDASVLRISRLRYWREGDAEVVVRAWRRSGETFAEFGRRYGVEPRRLSLWASRLGDDARERLHFHPVRATASRGDVPAQERIEIVVARGSVLVPSGFSTVELQRVLRVLEGDE